MNTNTVNLLECHWCGSAGKQSDNGVFCKNSSCEGEAATPEEWNQKTIEALQAEVPRLRRLAKQMAKDAKRIEQRLEAL